MKSLIFDAVVIGGGAAGLSAAIEINKKGNSVVVIEREDHAGGVLKQCIHNGFGLHFFKEELTGPEFAAKLFEHLQSVSIPIYFSTTVTDIINDNDNKKIICYSSTDGVFEINTRAVVLAMGCRERNRGNIATPGTRPAGIFTAGLAQKLINEKGYIPGNTAVIVGSGDIGLIMARRLTWSGVKVKAVVEIQNYPAGLKRNIAQCLEDFDIPLKLSHTVSNIYGRDRVESVDITPIINGIQDNSKTQNIKCDTILLSVGLVPENELSKKAGVEINYQHNGPFVNSNYSTNVKGIFACGNVLHVHDLVDFVAEEATLTGGFVSYYLQGKETAREISAVCGANLRYLVPTKIDTNRNNRLFCRSMIVSDKAKLIIKNGENIIKEEKMRYIQPSEMISINFSQKELNSAGINQTDTIRIELVPDN